MCYVPEFRRPNELQLLPKDSKRELGSIVLMSFSMSVRTLWMSAKERGNSQNAHACGLHL